MLSAMEGMRARGHDVTLAARSNSQLAIRAGERNFTSVEIDYNGDFDPRTSWQFYKLCRDRKVDVLCCNMQRVLRVAGPAARLAGVRAVVPRVGSQAPLGKKLSHRWSWGIVASGIIANSRATAQTLSDSAPYLPDDHIHVIYNGLNLDKFAATAQRRDLARRAMETSDEAPVIGMVGELTQRKNHIAVLRCLPALVERLPDTRLWIIGEGDQRKVLADEARDLGVQKNVVLAGFRDDVPDLICGMDVLAHPALMEGFGYVLVEAMAAGVPVVSSNTSNLPEIIDEGATGFLLDPEDQPMWTKRLGEILSDGEMALRLGARGFEQAHERFTIGRMLDELEEYFAELVGR